MQSNLQKALKRVLNGTKDERVFLCEHSFILFVIYYFNEYLQYKLAPYHYDFADDVENLVNGKLKEVMWIAYRESAKTSYAKLFVIWCIVYKKKKYINVDSFNKENSERILFDIAFELSKNQRLVEDFGKLFSRERNIDDVKQTKINNFVTENGIRVEAYSTQESARGRIHRNQRPDMFIFDDIETNKTKDSEAYTSQIRDHITEIIAGLAGDGSLLFLGNYITEYGNINWLMERAKNDDTIKLRNIPILNEDGNPTWEDKYVLTDEEAIGTNKISIETKKRQLGSVVFSYEMMNMPIDDALSEFKKEFIQYSPEPNHLNTNTFITIDPAVSEKTSADFTGITICKVSEENKWYIKSYHLKVNTKALIDHIFYLYETYRPVAIGIEKTSFTIAIEPFLQEEMRKRNIFPYIKPLVHNTSSKETRIRGIIPRWESKSIYLIGDNKDLLDEMRTFPRGKHDDCIAKGSLITTPTGTKKIENIKVGDFVLTRKGFKEVVKTWDKGELPVIKNIGITGTKDHKVITKKGEKHLEKITETDILYICKEKQLLLMVSNFIDTLTQKEHNIKNTTGLTTQTKNHLFHFIGIYGLKLMVKFLKVFMFTTKTIIRLITHLKIWNLYLQETMPSIIVVYQIEKRKPVKMLKRTTKNSKKQQKSGDIQKKVENGTQNTLKRVLINLERLFVRFVVKKPLDTQKMQNIVVRSVATNTTTTEHTEKRKRVYDLMVKDTHEFFVNGVLVHNCVDSLSMVEEIAYKPAKNLTESEILGEETFLYSDIGI